MNERDEGDWLARCLDTLRNGWRGRLRLASPEEADATGLEEEIIGTVVGETSTECYPDSDDIADAIVTVCVNYRDGAFVALADCPRCAVRVSRIVDMQPL